MVELRYHRLAGHAQHDNLDYVDPEELKEWKAKDPLVSFREALLADGRATAEDLGELEEAAFGPPSPGRSRSLPPTGRQR